MKIIILIRNLILFLVMGYTVYSDQRAEQVKCKRVEMINFVTLIIGVLLWNVYFITTL